MVMETATIRAQNDDTHFIPESEFIGEWTRKAFYQPRREFLRKYFNVPLENANKFHEWREYLYLNVLSFLPEPVYIETWPEETPQPKAA